MMMQIGVRNELVLLYLVPPWTTSNCGALDWMTLVQKAILALVWAAMTGRRAVAPRGGHCQSEDLLHCMLHKVQNSKR